MTETQATRDQRPNPFRELAQPFIDAIRAPRVLWGNNLQYFLEGFLYFGILNYLVIYAIEDIGLNEIHSGWVVTLLTGGITLSQFFFGGLADRWGPRRGLLVALAVLVLGRGVLAAAGTLGLSTEGVFSPALLALLAGVLIIVLGYGLYEPSAYSIVRNVTSPKTAAMGFAMLYALMNLGGWLPSLLPAVRRALGIGGIYWLFTGLTLVTLLVTGMILTRTAMRRAVDDARAERARIGQTPEDRVEEAPDTGTVPATAKRASLVDWLKNHPLADLRFTFFIFVLIPVQTLFAHNWLTLPLYVQRAYKGTWIGDNFEVAVNFNPLLIFIMVPIVAAATRTVSVYRLMVVGTLIMAAPAFLLAIEPSLLTLAAYLITMTVGEAIWQPRFLQYAAEIAPEGRTGAYMGVARLPWFLTKMITGAYSGWFLARYCPSDGELNTEAMWLIYGLIAMATPVLLLLAGRWMRKSLSG